MLRHSARETPIHLITNEQAYVDVRAPVSWISYLDFNAMYPAAMSLPNGPCETVALPEENAARLSWLHG